METATVQKQKYRVGGYIARHPNAALVAGSVVYFIALFFTYFVCRAPWPFTDETDVFAGGAAVLNDPGLYLAYVSQHMPVSYYIAAVPALFGARTLDQYRIIIGLMMSVIWTLNMLHNRKHLPMPVLILTPFFYLFQTLQVGGFFQSDHWQGMGIVFLLYEIFRYERDNEKKITVPSACWISFSIFLSFGSSFIAAYTMLTVFLAALAIMSVHLYRIGKSAADNIRERRRSVLFQFFRMIVICIIPFAVLSAIYLIKGKFGAFIEGAYYLNTQIYQKYANGLGSDPLGTFFDMFRICGSDILKTLSGIVHGEFTPANALAAIRHFCVLLFTVKLITGRKYLLAGAFLLIFITSAARGLDTPHAMPAFCVAAAGIALCVNEFVLFCAAKRFKALKVKTFTEPFIKPVRICACICVLICSVLVLAPLVKRIVTYTPNIAEAWKDPGEDKTAEVMNTLYRPGDRYEVLTGVDPEVGMITLRLKAPLDMYSGAASTPWTYDCYGERQLEALKGGTKFVLYKPGQNVWGHDLDTHTRDIVDYVNTHYTKLYGCLYIRNEDYEESRRILSDKGIRLE